MIRIRKIVFFTFIFIVGLSTSNAQTIPKDYFSSPLNIPLLLSGNFGEMRTNHFHTGLDFKTKGRIGFPVLSIDDGWVSRIKVSTSGYGNALYIDHANGYTSVYAHLDKYDPIIAAFLEDAQYNIEQFTVDIYPGKGKIPVKRGQEIGKSGNTGHSGGPHLHFEIRETETEFPVNPLLFGFDVKDHKEPKAYSIMAIPLDENSKVYGEEFHDVVGNNRINGSISVSGNVGFAIKTYDYYDGTSNMCGTYNVKLYCDSSLIYSHTLDKLDFSTRRFVNAHVVYDHFKKTKSRFQRSYKLPFDELKIYDEILEKGQCFHEANKIYNYRYELLDYDGNKSVINFQVKSKALQVTEKVDDNIFYYNQANEFVTDEIAIYIPNERLYDDFRFECHTVKSVPGLKSPMYKVSTPEIPLQDYFLLKIKAEIEDSLMRSKAVVIKYDSSKDKITALGGQYQDGWMEVKTKNFGNFGVMIDSIKPKISNIDFKKNMKGAQSVSFKITDNLSGILNYRMLIDGKWVLGKYYPNRAKLIYHFDENRLSHGNHTILVLVEDERGNENVFTGEFEW